MVKRALFKNLDIKVVNLRSVLGDVKRKGVTGFLKVTYWSKDDFLLFVDGEPLKFVSIHTDGRRTVSPPQNFKLEEMEGTASLFECTVDDLVGFQKYHYEPKKSGPLFLFPVGVPVQEPTPVSFLDPNKEFLLAQRSHLNGYIAIFTREDIIGLIVFSEGQPVEVFGGDASFGRQGIDFINANLIPAKSYIAMYTLEPEVLAFLYSMRSDNIRLSDSTFMTYAEAEELVATERKDTLIFTEGGGLYRYDFFFRGQRVVRLIKDKGFFVMDEENADRLSVKVENFPDRKIKVYEVSLVERPEPIEVVIESVPEEAPSKNEIPPEKLEEVKSAFIKGIGPVGKLVWDKILNELGFTEDSLNVSRMKVLVDRLREELPEEEIGREFLRKVKEVLPDIT